MRTMTITMYRNRIAFENMDHFPDDGNGQQHTKAAAYAWAAAAERVLIAHAGSASYADIRYGNDSGLHGPDGDNIEATRIVEIADRVGWEAARKTVWHG